ncbi:TolC family protein [Metapseudomonas furukawaii]|uniref:Heavy metal RND efflux outer membrane protein n=1 Tax=Metapseudomonas furukawaii TaxID=1149133 RepID=A0AAD1C467_METFU|nr:Heavy metal RND efflux outer membrane protein, CzcC family [Pseudomonas furukawaii]BAU75798.1 heavy metal RND efflux outer membrane protein [Pseudomonas furukawaii]
MTSLSPCPGLPVAAALAMMLFALPSQAASLSLDDALQLAERNAPSLSAQAAKLDAAKNAAIPAGELPDPKLALGVQNVPIEGEDRWSLDRDFMTMQMVGVMQEMPNRDKRKARVETAQASVDRATAEAEAERVKVRRETALAWIATYTEQRKLARFDDFFRENRLLAETVRARLAGGRGQALDAVEPKQEAAQLAEQQDDLALRVAQARAALKRWVGQEAARPLAGDFPHWPIDASRYLHALHRHPELATYEPMAREAEAQVREAEAEKKSDWSWEVDYQRRGREFGDMMTVQFTFDLPLFSSTRQDPKIAARRAQVGQLEAEREALLREHAQQLEADLADYQRLDRAVARSQSTLVPLAEEKVALALAGYRAGNTELASVIAARRELVQARLKELDVQGLKALAAARLYFTYGEGRP